MLSWLQPPLSGTHRFLFLDRDGVLNEDRDDYIKHWGEVVFYPDALDALRWLHERGIRTILVSNQSALHRGLTTWGDFWEIHNRVVDRIRERGGDLLAAFYCPHRPEEHCLCRKPLPGMLLTAAKLYAIPLSETYLIGDRPTDLLAARRAGCRGVRLNRERLNPAQNRAVDWGEDATPRYATLMEAVLDLFGT